VLLERGIVDAQGWDSASSRSAVSYALLRSPGQQGRTDIFEGVVRNLRLSNGVYRTTCRSRFADVDALACQLFARHFRRDQDLSVHDWAASDCLSSAEFARLMIHLFPKCSFRASDVTFDLVEVSTSRQTYVFEGSGTPLQYVLPPLVICLVKPLTRYPLNRLVALWALARSKPLARLVRLCKWTGLDDNRVFVFKPWTLAKIPLVHPAALEFRRSCPAFDITIHSVFCPLYPTADVIRTMNILNPVYFNVTELAEGIVSVFRSLRIGGIWIVGRTTEEQERPRNQVTIMRKEAEGFSILERMNGGWPSEHLVSVAVQAEVSGVRQHVSELCGHITRTERPVGSFDHS